MVFRVAALALIFGGSICRGQSACATCHPDAARTYQRTGMARSFYRPGNVDVGSYDHKPSAMHYEMVQRDGKYFQRQYQTGFEGKPANLRETKIDYVLGSGNHARSYLHRTAENTLVLLPLGWYAEKGGTWAMNPGYDRPDHQGLRRSVTYDCMFCHNAYPEIPPGRDGRGAPVYSKVPEGIDCQRCHGNGERHMILARMGGTAAEVRGAIVNPARLTPERQMEVCMQCHLETTSSNLPASIVRYERGPFSYKPGESLSDFMLHFDHAAGTGHDDKFEITGSAYRLRKSQCFLKSNAALTCTTCHDPHNAGRADYNATCAKCHSAEEPHTRSGDCVGCHMPKRRTDDVVHAVMTDHFIQRRPAASIAEKAEQRQTEYRGEVVLYYPKALPKPEDELYLAIAQGGAGIARLAAAIDRFQPGNAEYYFQLGDAWSSAGKHDRALGAYEAGLRYARESESALVRIAVSLTALQQYSRADAALERAIKAAPKNAEAWVQKGLNLLAQAKTPDAIAAFESATQMDPEMVDAYNLLGAMQFESGDAARGESTLRKGIQVQPNFAPLRNNLGNLLSETGRFEEAKYHFEAALRYKEDYLGARYNYALALKRVNRLDEAQAQIEMILRANPNSAEGHEFLGNLLSAKGQTGLAIEQYREAVRIEPEFDRANLDLGIALSKTGNPASGLPYLQKAARSKDEPIRSAAARAIERLAPRR